MAHLLAWLLPSCAAALFCLVIGITFLLIYNRGVMISTPLDHPPEDIKVIPVIEEEESPPFFDEHDLAMMEQHLEDPHFHGTVVELNGDRVGPDGMLPERKDTRGSLWSWLRRGD